MGMPNYACVRFTLCYVNLMFWVLGCGALGVGIWLHFASKGYSTLVMSYHMLSGDRLIILAGILTVFVGFLGCCGSWFQNKCLLRAYFILIIAILLMEFTAGTLGFIYRKHVGDVLQEELLVGLRQRYTTDNRNGLKEVWDHIQSEFQCCGVKQYQDWFHISAWPEKDWVPFTCCIPQYTNSSTCGQKMQAAHWYRSGCYPKIHNWLMERLYVVGIICLMFAFIQIFGIISALIIICSLTGRRK